ncbi:MAG TPA: uracil-DNA glycosylase [Candidatus Avamphibacillus intestinigallinarum]|nr:uracil-DNA glycosylase [Candidatus Avamphibacillus intestinigallinarum]
MFIPDEIHSSWLDFLTDERIQEIRQIESQIGNDYNPTNPNNVLRFLTTNLNNMKVVWLGQDVYPAKGVATGRAFEVGGLTSWLEPFRQVSLKNIVRLLYKNYHHINRYDDIKTYAQIKKEIASGTFPIVSPEKWFSNLENQGVLFLNTSFTCKIGEPNTHTALWKPFSEKVIRYISHRRPDLRWFLWGKEAQSNKPFIQAGIIKESRHPARVSKTYRDDFLNFTGFEETINEINWLG